MRMCTAATAAPSAAPASTSSSTCWRVASVEYRMPTHHSALSTCSAQPLRISSSRRASHRAVNTANATCSDGQALAARSTSFRNCIDGGTGPSGANGGAAVGQIMNRPKPMTLMAKVAAP